MREESITIAVLSQATLTPTRVERLPNDAVKLRRFCARLAAQGETRRVL